MKLKITGRIFATFNEVVEEIVVDLSQNFQISIDHNGLFTGITVGDCQRYFEKDSVTFELI